LNNYRYSKIIGFPTFIICDGLKMDKLFVGILFVIYVEHALSSYSAAPMEADSCPAHDTMAVNGISKSLLHLAIPTRRRPSCYTHTTKAFEAAFPNAVEYVNGNYMFLKN
jgi:hypothetical protein